MLFKEFGNKSRPTIIFLHGGGLSWWSWKRQIEALQDDYHIIAPIIDGHGEAGDTEFQSIEKSAEQVAQFIREDLTGHVHMLCGLSLGAQIIVEMLSRDENITDYAIIESGLVCPIKNILKFSLPMFSLFYGLIKKEWYSRIQAKSMKVPDDMFDNYYKDSKRITKESLLNMTKSNGYYEMPSSLTKTKAKALILVGEKELSVMKKSASRLNAAINDSSLIVMKKFNHGEISLANPDKYIELMKQLMKGATVHAPV